MRPCLTLCLALAATLIPAAGGATPPGPVDQAALERLAAENDAAWNAGDAAAISLQYSQAGSLRLSGMADAIEGRDAVRAYFVRSFSERPAMLRHLTRLERVDMLGPDLAFADAHVRVEQRRGERWELVRSFVNHSVLSREEGLWRLHAVRAHRLP